MTIRICSFNVNGVRARPHQLEALINTVAPDIIGLQETKVADDTYPLEQVAEWGYKVLIHGQKAHHGVSIMYKESAHLQLKSWEKDIPGLNAEKHPRFIRAQFLWNDAPLWVMNGYFPQGESLDHPVKFPYKVDFYEHLTQHLHDAHTNQEKIVVMGDINISPQDIDIGIGEDNKKRWLATGKCSFLPQERAMLQKLCDFGLSDTYRLLYPAVDDKFSWFDYRSRGFNDTPKRGLRIDQIWCTEPLISQVKAADICYDIRGLERPSDHAPIWTEFS